MPLDTVDSLIEALRGRPILRPEQFDELIRQYGPSHVDTQELARTLIKLGWITIYQAKKLISGKADELVIGPYVVLDKLGEGGMGKVYKAMQLSLGRIVALKVMRGALLKNEVALKRFQREVRAAAKLNHPNIVRVFDADQVGDRHFLVMEHITGYDLARVVRERGQLPIGMACSIIRQASLGLQHAHDQGFIHRDIKPSNLLLAHDAKGQHTLRSTVKILDMGLARVQSDEANLEHLSTELTRTGTVIGTPDYMSPEQAKNSSAVDHRSDLYALGCTFYFLLTGEPPFATGTPLEKLLQHQMDAPRPVQLVRLEIPPQVATIVHCLLAKRPEERFQSAAALAHALEPWCTSEGKSGLHPATILHAEAVDPGSATLETVPHDPFDFGADVDATTPESIRRPPPLPRQVEKKRKRFPWLYAALGLLAVGFLFGAVAAGIAAASRKKTDDPPSPGNAEPAPKPPPKAVKTDPPPARDIDSVERFLPDDSALVFVFDLKHWQSSPQIRQMILTPLVEKLAGFHSATGVDMLAATERVVVGITPDDKPGDVLILQGRGLVTPRLVDGVKAMPGVTFEPARPGGPDLVHLGSKVNGDSLYGIAIETSIVLSKSKDRVLDALAKKDGARRTKLADPTIERGLEYAQSRPFAAFATLGLRQGWAQTQTAAAKLNFIAAGIIFDERGMHLHTLGDDSEVGKVAELQKAFGKMLADKANVTDPPDLRAQRIAELLLSAEPAKAILPKFRRSHLYYLVPSRKLEEWFAPFLANRES